MARSQALDYDKKRCAITQNAARLFAARGFATCSVAEIADACGMSKSLIYHYYQCKEDILFDVMNEHIELLLRETHAFVEAGPPEAALRDLTQRLLLHYVDAAERQKVTLYEMDSLPEQQRSEIIEKQREIVANVEALLRNACRSQAKDERKLSALTMLYFGMLNWTHTWFKASGPLNRDALATLAADTIIGAL